METIQETVDRCWPELQSWDYALPQPWVDKINNVLGENPIGHFVWAYDCGSLGGFPLPVTPMGAKMMYETSNVYF